MPDTSESTATAPQTPSTSTTAPSNSTPSTGQPAGSQDGSSNSSPEETETVDYWKSRARDNERRAKANAEAAKRLQQIEDAQKTEAERAAEALNAEKARADAAERAALSLRIATEHHLGADDADLLAGLPDEDAMRKLAKRLEAQHADEAAGDQGQGQQRVGYGVDHSRTQSSPPPSADDAARAFFGI